MPNDLVSDMLTRIRNATLARHSFVRVNYSKLNLAILKVLTSEGYIMTNCVSCCEMCNFMKGCLGPTIFINRVEHIMTHLGLFKGNLHSEDFKNTTHVEYGTYKFSANKRQHEFSISKSQVEFHNIK